MKLKDYAPLWRQVLLKDVTKKQTDSGIILHDTAVPFNMYEVAAKGEECIAVKKGDKVIIPNSAINHVTPLVLEGKEYIQCTEQLIIGIFK